jgi:hypothetical protein
MQIRNQTIRLVDIKSEDLAQVGLVRRNFTEVDSNPLNLLGYMDRAQKVYFWADKQRGVNALKISEVEAVIERYWANVDVTDPALPNDGTNANLIIAEPTFNAEEDTARRQATTATPIPPPTSQPLNDNQGGGQGRRRDDRGDNQGGGQGRRRDDPIDLSGARIALSDNQLRFLANAVRPELTEDMLQLLRERLNVTVSAYVDDESLRSAVAHAIAASVLEMNTIFGRGFDGLHRELLYVDRTNPDNNGILIKLLSDVRTLRTESQKNRAAAFWGSLWGTFLVGLAGLASLGLIALLISVGIH